MKKKRRVGATFFNPLINKFDINFLNSESYGGLQHGDVLFLRNEETWKWEKVKVEFDEIWFFIGKNTVSCIKENMAVEI